MTTLTHVQELQSLFSDLYKDVNGVRPRHLTEKGWNSVEFLESQIESLEEQLVVVMAQQKLDQQDAVVKFEDRVQQTIKLGAKTRQTALKWIHEAENTNGDDEYLCFCVGIPYGYFVGEF
jgi:hypothetical protein